MHIIWDGEIQPANRAELERLLKPWLWLVPGWVQTVAIFVYGSDNPDSVAISQIKEQYREVIITIRPRWFTSSEKEKTATLIHELIHIHTNPLYDFALNAIRKYSENDAMQQVLIDEAECYLERSTQDLAFVIGNRIAAKG